MLFVKVKRVVFSHILMDPLSSFCVPGSYLTKETCVSVYYESHEGKWGIKTDWKIKQWKIKVKKKRAERRTYLLLNKSISYIVIYMSFSIMRKWHMLIKKPVFFPLYVLSCKPATSNSWAPVKRLSSAFYFVYKF